MKLAIGLASAAALLGSGALIAAQRLEEPLGERPPEVVYTKTCGYCHGRNVGPVILGRHLDPATVRMMVRRGPNGMPAFRPTEVTDAELTALADWIMKSKADPKEHGK